MAPVLPSKRRRAQTNDLYFVDGDAGPSQQGRSKRPKPHTSQGFSSQSSSDEDDSASSQNEARAVRNHNDADDDAEAFRQQTQVVAKNFRDAKGRKNAAAEQGIVEEIRCTNFMCHEQLHVKLGPLINFIIGHNGSGKSAVLTALTLCLGGKATATNRGQNLKSFIKEGRDYCVLSVRIKNQGTAAYKPEIYGKSIIVERHFNKAGTSGFKVKDANGKIVSTKKSELEDIIDAFALQIDNPMNVLTQDMARQFLNDSRPQEKYKFFLKGTQLETLNAEYMLVDEQLQELMAKAEVVNNDIHTYKKQLEHATKQARRAANLEAVRQRERAYMNQIVWAHVESREKELAEVEAEIESVNGIIKEKTHDADSASEQYELANQAWSDANQTVQDREADMVPVNEECAILKEQFDDTKSSLIKVKGQQRNIGSIIKSKQKAIDKYEVQIQEERQRQIEADNGLHAQKMEELDKAKHTHATAKAQLESHGEGLAELNRNLSVANGKAARARQEVEEKQEQLRRSQKTIRDIERGQNNWMDGYLPNLPKLLKAIADEQRFRETPVGPIGRHIKLLKQEWSSILEKSSGGTLNAFVVTSKTDQNILSGLMRRTNCQCPILIGTGQHIDTSRHEPPTDLDTWMRAVKIDNDLVRNQMIINHAIEQIVLIPNRQEGQKFMHEGGSRRENVKICFTFADKNPRKGHSITFNSNSGAVNINPISEYTGPARMQADKEPQLRAEGENFERLNQEFQRLRTTADQFQREAQECQNHIKEHEKRKRRLEIKFQEAQTAVEELEADLNSATPNATLITQLEEELRVANGEKKFQEEQFQDLVNEIDKLDEQQRGRRARLQEVQGRLAQLESELRKASAKALKLGEKREQALRQKNQALQEVNEAQEIKSEWEVRRNEEEKQLEEVKAQAQSVCHRVDVPPGESVESLEKRLERMQKERQQSEKELGASQEELLRAANIAKKTWNDAKNLIAEMNQVENVLMKSLSNRKDRWEQFRTHISVRARVVFQYLLSERRFRGTLDLDHEQKLLDIKIEPDITKRNDAGRQTKTLSGGEKSFSTTCLLLALWDAMGSPIRCLDEFDVFMDSVNREISVKMICEAARRSVGRQYILITPQAMSSVVHDDDVTVIRMSDPERGQTALPFAR